MRLRKQDTQYGLQHRRVLCERDVDEMVSPGLRVQAVRNFTYAKRGVRLARYSAEEVILPPNRRCCFGTGISDMDVGMIRNTYKEGYLSIHSGGSITPQATRRLSPPYKTTGTHEQTEAADHGSSQAEGVSAGHE